MKYLYHHIRHSLLALLLLAYPAILIGQEPVGTEQIHASVLDGDTDKPIPGATVSLVQFDSTGEYAQLKIGGITNQEGYVLLDVPEELQDLGISIRSIGYESTLLRYSKTNDSLFVFLFPKDEFAPLTVITAKRRSRSVEDGCCRVESIREEVQQHAPFSPSPVESLRRYSSCTSGRTINTIDNAGTISLRGLEPTRVGLLLDGIPLFSGLTTFYGLSMIPSHSLQTIQIAEGASNGRYGNGAISGIVDLQTRVPTEEPELNASINFLGESTTPDQYDLNLGYTGLIGDVGVALFGSFNDHRISVPDGNKMLYRDYQRFSSLAKGNMLIDDQTEVILTLFGGIEERTGTVEQAEIGTYQHNLDLNQINATTSISRFIGEQGELQAKGGFSQFNAEGMINTSRLDAKQSMLYGEIVWSDLIGSHDYQIGLQGKGDRITTHNNNGIEYDNSILSFFAQNGVQIAENWDLFGSLRGDKHSVSGFLLSPRGSLRFAPSDIISMRLMAGQGFKGEAIFDEDYRSLISTMKWRPNQDIEFERSLTLNYDINWSWVPSEAIGASGNLNFYYTRINNKLTPNLDSLAAQTLFYENSSQPARLLGLEWQTRLTIEGGVEYITCPFTY